MRKHFSSAKVALMKRHYKCKSVKLKLGEAE
jgi:hypothetical protein